jgi:DNA-binding beta-propeller fold protein YncE
MNSPSIILSCLHRAENNGVVARATRKVAAGLLALLVLATPAVAAGPLKLVQDVPLPGSTARFDYQAIDPATHRLFISHMGAGSVIVFDLAGCRVLADLPGFPGATGITSDEGHAFVSVTGGWLSAIAGGGKIAALDTHSLKTEWTVDAGRFPDGSAVAPGTGRLFVSDESGGQELVIDAKSGRLLATIALGGEAGMTAFDPRSRHILVNVQTARALVAIDPATNAIVARHALPKSCDNNHGLLVDAPARRAFIACDGNAALLVFDLDAARVTQTLSTARGPDVLALDERRGRLYVASESGTVSVYDTGTKDVVKLGESHAGENAHSVAVDRETGLLYLPVRSEHGHPVLRIMEFVGH